MRSFRSSAKLILASDLPVRTLRMSFLIFVIPRTLWICYPTVASRVAADFFKVERKAEGLGNDNRKPMIRDKNYRSNTAF
jgi:hypothetical protein